MAVVRIQLRRDTASNWTTANPTLAAGEIGIETDTDQFKIGDGATSWSGLGYGGLQGPQGIQGEQGIQGIQGEVGPVGPAGADGGFDSTQTIADLGSNYTLQSTDAGKLFTNSAAVTVTVQNLSVGQQVDFFQRNAAQITFVAGGPTGVIYSKDSKLKTAGQYSAASIKCISTDTYALIGDLGA